MSTKSSRDDALAVLISTPAMARRLYPRDGPTAVGANALQVLAVLVADPHAEVASITVRLALTRPTVSGAVRELREAGLVMERPGAADKRSRVYKVTEAGVAEASRLIDHALRVLEQDVPAD